MATCGALQVLPRQVGGDLGDTDFTAWDFYVQGSGVELLAGIYLSEASDIVTNSGATLSDPSAPFTVLQVCRLNDPLLSWDEVCEEVFFEADARAVRFMQGGTKLLLLTQELQLIVVEVASLSVLSARQMDQSHPLFAGLRTDWVINNDSLRVVDKASYTASTTDASLAYLLLSQDIDQILTNDESMSGVLIKFDISGSDDFEVGSIMHQLGIGTLWANEQSYDDILEDFGQPDLVWLYSGLNVFSAATRAEQIHQDCTAEESFTAYWTSYVDFDDNIDDIEDSGTNAQLKQTSCLLMRCNHGQYKDEVLLEACFFEPQTYPYARTKQTSIPYDALSYAKLPTVLIGSTFVTVTSRAEANPTFYSCWADDEQDLLCDSFQISDPSSPTDTHRFTALKDLAQDSSGNWQVYATVDSQSDPSYAQHIRLVRFYLTSTWQLETVMSYAPTSQSFVFQAAPVFSNSAIQVILGYSASDVYTASPEVYEATWTSQQSWLTMVGDTATTFACVDFGEPKWLNGVEVPWSLTVQGPIIVFNGDNHYIDDKGEDHKDVNSLATVNNRNTLLLELVPECRVDYSLLEYPTEALSTFEPQSTELLIVPFEVTLTESLDVDFSFRPAVLLSQADDPTVCINQWQLQSLNLMGTQTDMATVFAQSEASLTSVTVEGFQHVIVTFQATFDSDWVLTQAQGFPLTLALEFTLLQSNLQGPLSESLTEYVYVTVDLPCLKPLKLSLAPDSAISEDMTVYTFFKAYSSSLGGGSYSQIELPTYEALSEGTCDQIALTRSITVNGEDLAQSQRYQVWLQSSEKSLLVFLSNYMTDEPAYQGSLEHCYTIAVTYEASITQDYGPLNLESLSDTLTKSFELCIQLEEPPPPTPSYTPLPTYFFTRDQPMTVSLPPIESHYESLQVSMKVLGESVPDKCAILQPDQGQDCPVRLITVDELTKQYQIERQTIVSETSFDELAYETLVRYEDELGGSLELKIELVEEKRYEPVQVQEVIELPVLIKEEPEPQIDIVAIIAEYTDEILTVDEQKQLQSEIQKANLDPKMTPTIPKAIKMTDTGLLTVRFEPTIFEPKDEDLEALKEEDLLQLTVLPSSDSLAMLHPTGYNLTWSFVEVTNKEMQIQVDFAHPLNISLYPQPDQVMLTFKNTSNHLIPRIVHSQSPIAEGFMSFIEIPAQMPKGFDTSVSLKKAAMSAVQTTLQGSGVATISISFLMSFSLQLLWGMINGLQLVVHLPLFKVSLPGTTMRQFKQLQYIVSAFDFTEEFLAGYYAQLGLTETDPYNFWFNNLGYEQLDIIKNMGSILLALALILCRILYGLVLSTCKVTWRFKKCCKRRTRPGKAKKRCFQVKFYWPSFKQSHVDMVLRFFLESQLEVLLCVTIALGFESAVLAQGKLSRADQACEGTMYALMALLLAFPLIVVYFTVIKSARMHQHLSLQQRLRYADHIAKTRSLASERKNRGSQIRQLRQKSQLSLDHVDVPPQRENRLREKQFEGEFGLFEVLYADLDMRKLGARFFSLLFVMRRALFVAFIFWEPLVAVHQMAFFVATCLIQASFLLHWAPFQSRLANASEVVNELFLLMIGYLFMCLTGLVYRPNEIHIVGYWIFLSILGMIGYNCLMLLGITIFQLRQGCRRSIKKMSIKKQLKHELPKDLVKWKKTEKCVARKRAMAQAQDSAFMPQQTLIKPSIFELSSRQRVLKNRQSIFESIQERNSDLEQSFTQDQKGLRGPSSKGVTLRPMAEIDRLLEALPKIPIKLPTSHRGDDSLSQRDLLGGHRNLEQQQPAQLTFEELYNFDRCADRAIGRDPDQNPTSKVYKLNIPTVIATSRQRQETQGQVVVNFSSRKQVDRVATYELNEILDNDWQVPNREAPAPQHRWARVTPDRNDKKDMKGGSDLPPQQPVQVYQSDRFRPNTSQNLSMNEIDMII